MAAAQTPSDGTVSDRDLLVRVAKAAAVVIAVGAVAFGIWQVRSVLILLLLAVTFAAAIRPGVEWLGERHVPQSIAIFLHFLVVGAVVAVLIWLAVPPAIHQIGHALQQSTVAAPASGHTAGVPDRMLSWLQQQLHRLPTGTDLIHPIATYGHKAGEAIVAIFFTLAATWYSVSERDDIIKLLTSMSPESKRDKARQTYLALDQRLGAYTRLRFALIFATGAVLALGFWAIGLDYWLLLGATIGLLEIVPIIGPLVGSILVLAVGLPQSLHIALLSLLWLIVVREFQTYVVNPHVGKTVGLSPLVTLMTVAIVGLLFGGLAVILAVPVTSAVATLIDVLVLGHEPPVEEPSPRSLRLRRSTG